MSYYPELDSYIRDKVKVVLGLSNYATKKRVDTKTEIDTCNLPAKKDFTVLEQQFDKLENDKLVNVPTSLNNKKQK